MLISWKYLFATNKNHIRVQHKFIMKNTMLRVSWADICNSTPLSSWKHRHYQCHCRSHHLISSQFLPRIFCHGLSQMQSSFSSQCYWMIWHAGQEVFANCLHLRPLRDCRWKLSPFPTGANNTFFIVYGRALFYF